MSSRGIFLLASMICNLIGASGEPQGSDLPTNAASGSSAAMRKVDSLFEIPADYRREATSVLLKEADDINVKLGLGEPIPFHETNLVEVSLVPPRIGREKGQMGMVRTRRYAFFGQYDWKVSSIERVTQEREALE